MLGKGYKKEAVNQLHPATVKVSCKDWLCRRLYSRCDLQYSLVTWTAGLTPAMRCIKRQGELNSLYGMLVPHPRQFACTQSYSWAEREALWVLNVLLDNLTQWIGQASNLDLSKRNPVRFALGCCVWGLEQRFLKRYNWNDGSLVPRKRHLFFIRRGFWSIYLPA